MMAKKDDLANLEESGLVAKGYDDDSETLIKVTTYIRADQAFALELMENAERDGGGFNQAELFQEALDMLIKARIVAIRLPETQIAQKRD